MNLASISSSQPFGYGSSPPLQTAAHENTKIEDLEKSNTDPLESEPKKLIKKATEELSKSDQTKIQQLKNRDLEVKAHEQAHLSAAGSLAMGGASFTYTTGPNGIRYATGGEVSIDTSKVDGDPAATLLKADTIRRAALAPATPSAQDQLVANSATAMADTARIELVQQTQEEQKAKAADSTEKTDEQEGTDVDDDSEKNETSPPLASHSNSLKGSLLDLTV